MDNRTKLKEDLAWLGLYNPKCLNMFRLMYRMYIPGDMESSINEIIDKMPADTLDWALTQVKNDMKKYV